MRDVTVMRFGVFPILIPFLEIAFFPDMEREKHISFSDQFLAEGPILVQFLRGIYQVREQIPDDRHVHGGGDGYAPLFSLVVKKTILRGHAGSRYQETVLILHQPVQAESRR